MNPVKLKFRHGGEMLVSPIGLRFAPDPDLGTLVLIPDAQGPKGYQLDMTLEEAEQAFYSDQTQVDALAKKVYWLQEQLEKAEKGWTAHEERLNRIEPVLHQHYDRWRALAIHLGLPEGWERLHEGAAEAKGALVAQAELLDALQAELSILKEQDVIPEDIAYVKAHVDALYNELGLNSRWEGEKLVSYRDTDSILTEVVLMQREVSRLTEESSLFTVAERVEELEESRRIQREFLAKLSDEVHGLRSFKEEIHPTLSEKWEDTAFPLLDDRTCVQRSTWTVPQSVDRIETGRIEDEVNRLHGELDARVSDLENRMDEERSRIRTPWIGPDTVRLVLPEPEKPKSAWKPLAEALRCGDLLVRYNFNNSREHVREVTWSPRDQCWIFQDSHQRLTARVGYEFCPIPE